MKKILLLLSGLLICLTYQAKAQSFLSSGDEPVNGYSQKISGLDYEYQSCIPGLRLTKHFFSIPSTQPDTQNPDLGPLESKFFIIEAGL